MSNLSPEFNRKIISTIISHFHEGIRLNNITPYIEGELREQMTEWMEIRVADFRSRQIDSDQWVHRIPVNILCSTPSGQDLVNNHDIYRVEDLIGIAQSLFTGIHIEEIGCMSLDSGIDLRVFRPRQSEADLNLKQASVTGVYLLRSSRTQ